MHSKTNILSTQIQHKLIEKLASANSDLLIEVKTRKNTEVELQKALKTKDYLMKEMHHRIKNNLQLLISMLRLMKGNLSAKFKI